VDVVAIAEVAVKLGARNQDAAETGEFAEHLAPYQSAHRFLTDAEFRRAAFHVESLAFDCCCCIHTRSLEGDALPSQRLEALAS